jgi:WD40 repeat protein/serine/threonine protein kinase
MTDQQESNKGEAPEEQETLDGGAARRKQPDAQLARQNETVITSSPSTQPIGLQEVPGHYYVIEREVARGGMGRVLAAYDRRLGRQVAIKELLPADEGMERRFEREALMTARLQHPGIVNVHEAGLFPNGKPFYAMKMVTGRTLEQQVDETRDLDGRLSLLPNVIAAVDAIAYAHSRRVIHRDLKPANVLLGSFGETVVVDWGLAKDLNAAASSDRETSASTDAVAESMTIVGSIMGTPSYMSPEQASGEPVDEGTDVYALGMILYHLLAGDHPYKGKSSAEILRKVLSGPPVDLELRQPGAPSDLVAIVRKASARSPRNRYTTAKELAEDLKRFQTGQLVGAHRYSFSEIVRRQIQRNRTAFTVALAGISALTITGFLSVQRIAEERDIAKARTNELTLAQARSSLELDPTAALDWLKSYSAEGPDWSAARVIAADALSRGVSQVILRGHTSGVAAVAFSPDGQKLASAGWDGAVRLWDLSTEASQNFTGIETGVDKIAFAPNGRWLAIAAWDDPRLFLWNPSSGTTQQLEGHETGVEAIAFSPDSELLASVGRDETLRLWTVTSGAARVLSTNQKVAAHVSFSNDGRWLITQSWDDKVYVWDLMTGMSRVIEDRSCFALSAAGSHLVTGGANGTIFVTNLLNGNSQKLEGHSDRIDALAVSHDGELVASTADYTLRLWNLRDDEETQVLGNSLYEPFLTFSPDGRLLATTGSEQDEVDVVKLWDTATGRTRILRGHVAEVKDMAFSPDRRFIATAGEDQTVRLWDLEVGSPTVLESDQGLRADAALSPDGRFVAEARYSELSHEAGPRDIVLFDLERDERHVLDGKPVLPGPISISKPESERAFPIEQLANYLAFSPNSQYLASSCMNGTVFLWNILDGTTRQLTGHADAVISVGFDPHSRLLASTGADKSIRLWEVSTDETQILRGHQDWVGKVAFSPDGKLLASASWDNTARLWELKTGRSRTFSGHSDVVVYVAFSPNGRTLASGSLDSTVRLWNVDTGEQRLLSGHEQAVRCIAFSPDGTTLASAGSDSTVHIWDLDTGKSQVLKGHGIHVVSVAFSPDGRSLVTSSAGGDMDARLWDLTTLESRVLPHSGLHNIFRADFFPDGRSIMTAAEDGGIRIWRDDLPHESSALRTWLESATKGTAVGQRGQQVTQ